jgi:hypothetical protein
MTEKEELAFEMKDEYDFSNARRNPYAARANAQANLIPIEPELLAIFPDAAAVNEALRLVVKARDLTTRTHIREHQKAS